MQYDEMIERVKSVGGFERATDAERALRAVVGVLAGWLVEDERRALGAGLPPRLAQLLERRPLESDRGLLALYRAVARAEDVRLGLAIEHAQIVCRALAAEVEPSVVQRLRRHLPPEVAELFARDPRPAAPPPHLHAPAGSEVPAGGSLATGRPGSRHPIAEAHFAPAHAESVVRSSNPHGGSKLSSAPGSRQEGRRETLATGRPGSRRPLSEGKR